MKPKRGILTIIIFIFLTGCASSPRFAKPRSDPEGFRDIKWGTRVSALRDMEQVEQDRSFGRGVVWYRRKGDALTIGEAKLEAIYYAFWMGDFERVAIDFKGEKNFEALKKELFEQFGKAREPERIMEKPGQGALREPPPAEPGGALYVWLGKNTEIWLSYSRDRDKGTLTMNSKKIRDERSDYEKGKEKEERVREKRF